MFHLSCVINYRLWQSLPLILFGTPKLFMSLWPKFPPRWSHMNESDINSDINYRDRIERLGTIKAGTGLLLEGNTSRRLNTVLIQHSLSKILMIDVSENDAYVLSYNSCVSIALHKCYKALHYYVDECNKRGNVHVSKIDAEDYFTAFINQSKFDEDENTAKNKILKKMEKMSEFIRGLSLIYSRSKVYVLRSYWSRKAREMPIYNDTRFKAYTSENIDELTKKQNAHIWAIQSGIIDGRTLTIFMELLESIQEAINEDIEQNTLFIEEAWDKAISRLDRNLMLVNNIKKSKEI